MKSFHLQNKRHQLVIGIKYLRIHQQQDLFHNMIQVKNYLSIIFWLYIYLCNCSFILIENGNSALPTKRLTTILLHYASFLRRAKGDLSLAEVVLKKAAEVILPKKKSTKVTLIFIKFRSHQLIQLSLEIVHISLQKKRTEIMVT